MYILTSIISKSGPVNWVLGLIYLLSITIILDRAIYFFRSRLRAGTFRGRLFTLLDQSPGDLASVAGHPDLMAFQRSDLYPVVATYFTHFSDPNAALQQAIRIQEDRLISRAESTLWLLQLMGSLGPMLGLLGTISGLVLCFRSIETMKVADISVLSSGIWEAMSSTLLGLFIGIIALIFYRVFDHFVDKRIHAMEDLVGLLNIRFSREGLGRELV